MALDFTKDEKFKPKMEITSKELNYLTELFAKILVEYPELNFVIYLKRVR